MPRVQAIFRNTQQGRWTHIEEFTASAVVLPEGGCITLNQSCTTKAQ